jgi:hypothetical protein
MRVRVAGNHQVNYAGTVYGPGEEFEAVAVEPIRRLSAPIGHEASNEVAVWLESGWVEEVSKPKARRKARA